MSTLSFTVTDHDITADNQGELAQGSHNFDICNFTFDSTWSEYSRYAILYQNKSSIYKINIVNNICKIPIDVLQKPGKLYIGARGEKSNGESIVTTEMVSFWVNNGAIDGNTASTESVEAATLAGINEICAARDSALEEIRNSIGAPTEQQVSIAVKKYLDENPVSALDASTASENQIPVADGNGNWSWKTQQSGSGVESDPTVSEWAKQPNKPTYTADEVGALPDSTKTLPNPKSLYIQDENGNTITAYSGSSEKTVKVLTQHQDLSGYALKSEIPKSSSDIGAETEGTAASKVSEHNSSDTAHDDIRTLIDGLTTRLDILADTLEQIQISTGINIYEDTNGDFVIESIS